MFDVRCTAGRSHSFGLQYGSNQDGMPVESHQKSPTANVSHKWDSMSQKCDNMSHKRDSTLAGELSSWRNSFTVEEAKQHLRNSKDKEWTCAILFSGGCLDTLSAIRTGFTPTWGCERDQAQGRMWEHLTSTKCLGDVFGDEAAKASKVKYIKAGAPCQDYSRSGSRLGEHGETGWMFVQQAEVIDRKRPWAFCLEISDHADEVNGGKEVKKVYKRMSRHYNVVQKKLSVWRYGDPSNRKRIFMVGILRELGQAAHEFQFPRGEYNESRVPTARDIAVRDDEVENKYWRTDQVREFHAWSSEPGTLHKVASTGEGMGPAKLPHSIYSWDGLLNTQTTLNGGGRRPELNWKSGQKILRTRLTVPTETMRAASLPDDYITWCYGYADGMESHKFLRKCVNNGVPLRVGTAIDAEVMRVLTRAKHRMEQPVSKWASLAHSSDSIRHILFDTGANGSLCKRDVERWLSNAKPSSTSITVANKETLIGQMDGTLRCNVLNTAGHEGLPQNTEFSFNTTTTDGVAMELLSFDEFYRENWGVHCRPTILGGQCELYKVENDKSISTRVPLRYDWTGSGGFYLDYCVLKDRQHEHTGWLARHIQDEYRANTATAVGRVKYFDETEVRAMMDRCSKSKDVYEVIQGKAEGDRVIRGVKAGLRSSKQKLTERELHELLGHIGYMPGCKICKLAGGAPRRIRTKVDPHQEQRPGHTWHMDTVTMSHRSEEGCKYLTILRCAATGKFKLIPHYLRNDICELVEDWIEVIRKDPAFHNCPYKVVSTLKLDSAGEWDKDNRKWNAMVENNGVQCLYSCPDRKESHASAERNCGIVEVVVKSILMQSNLPPSWWQMAAAQAEYLLDRLPLASQAPTLGPMGDRARPLELFTRGAYERRQIDRELSYFLLLGTPALVHNTSKGSALKPKTRWGIAIGMYREQVIFRCPYSKSTFRSKSFAAFRLREGINFAQFLGLPELESTQSSAAIPADFNEVITVQLPHMLNAKIEGSSSKVIEEVIAKESAVPTVVAKPGVPELGGSVHVKDSAGIQLLSDSQHNLERQPNETLIRQSQNEGTPYSSQQFKPGDIITLKDDKVYTGKVQGWPATVIEDLGSEMIIECDGQRYQEPKSLIYKHKAFQGRCITSGEGDNFSKICKGHNLPHQQQGLYKQWLVDQGIIAAADIPDERRGARIRAGLNFPCPTGPQWLKAIERGSRKKRRALQMDIDDDEVATEDAENWIRHQVSQQDSKVRGGGRYSFNIRIGTAAIRAASGRKVKKRRTKAVSTGKVQAPSNTWEALTGEDAVDWVKSMGNEFYGLVEMGVFGLGYTKQQLLEAGIDLDVKPAVPIGEYYECKFDMNGELAKRKTRMAIQGHSRNMKKGIHFNETFAATPREYTGRLLQALVVQLNLSRLCFDITKAYCWADLPPNERIALKYPSAFQEYDPETGEELYLIQLKNLYGSPSAGRNFGLQRNETLMKKFNEKGWSCSRCRMDPCLFVISRSYQEGNKKTLKRAWMIAHVDDCDMAGEGDQILNEAFEVCQEIWKCEKVSSDFMLGIRRRLSYNDDRTVDSAILDMIPFVDGMVEAFKEHIPHPDMVRQPLPDKFTISKEDVVDEEEIRQTLEDGYQAGMGMALWASRHCFPECRLGCSLLCRVMAKPSRAAFTALMQMIAWMHKHRHRGIKFTAGINNIPMYLVDASNKPDPADGKCQYGYVCMWLGGPLLEHSKKLRHIGLSSQHNEYMAMHFANQSIVWLRQLLEEMGLKDLIKNPTILWADNKPANILSKEDIVGSGNQYIYQPYHFNKEVQEEGFSRVEYIKSTKNISDLMTKAVSVQTLKDLMPALTGYDHTIIQELVEAGAKLPHIQGD